MFWLLSVLISGHQSPKQGLLPAIHHLINCNHIQRSQGELPTGVRTHWSSTWHTRYLKMRDLRKTVEALEGDFDFPVTPFSLKQVIKHRTDFTAFPRSRSRDPCVRCALPTRRSSIPFSKHTRHQGGSANSPYSLHLPQDPLPYHISPWLSTLHQRCYRNHSCLMSALPRSISLQRLLSHIKPTNLYAFLLLIRLAEHIRLRCQHEQKEASFFPDATKRLSISHLWTTLRDLFIYTADDGNHFPLVKC